MPISLTPDIPTADTVADILLLGDTLEADALAEALQDWANCRVRRPSDMTSAVIEQMASVDGFAAFLRTSTIRLIVNAANPYEAELSDRALTAAAAAELPILRLIRPAWHRDQLDSWIDVASVAAAADICRWYGKRAMITLGEADLAPFAGNERCHFIVRLPVAPAAPLNIRHHDLIIDRGPFAWLDERRLMMEQQIDLLVSRNIGGHDSYAKIDVARDLAVPVVMISRPVQPLQPSAETVAQALIWIEAWQQSENHTAIDSRRTGEQAATTAESE
jgi:precorrin-6A/cobalt-precorrin-6A reductase